MIHPPSPTVSHADTAEARNAQGPESRLLSRVSSIRNRYPCVLYAGGATSAEKPVEIRAKAETRVNKRTRISSDGSELRADRKK